MVACIAGQPSSAKQPMPELVKPIEPRSDEQKRWTQRGLMVRAVDEISRERHSHRPILIGRALRAKDEDGWRGFCRFVAEHFRAARRGSNPLLDATSCDVITVILCGRPRGRTCP